MTEITSKEMALEALEQGKVISLPMLSAELQKDKEIVLAMIKNAPLTDITARPGLFVPRTMREDRQVMSALIQRNGYLIDYAGPKLEKDPALIALAEVMILENILKAEYGFDLWPVPKIIPVQLCFDEKTLDTLTRMKTNPEYFVNLPSLFFDDEHSLELQYALKIAKQALKKNVTSGEDVTDFHIAEAERIMRRITEKTHEEKEKYKQREKRAVRKAELEAKIDDAFNALFTNQDESE